ncbi:MAG: AAA family ATPase [Brevinematales bacterium]|nr:AAA family ATPase [Brevinematales bacterium]
MARYLKSIILQGFKSFPLKTEVELVDGITGIVGANGSGKSNIVEAIKWVLGEQSAKSLRGEKMEDIIFNGTKNRLPGSMAEVSLIFDNEKKWLPLDYSEVEITRRMFRSGEGQYFINKSKVRLKDIVELFLDTGIGRDSYAIFEQGKIDRLLSESPEERRILFEDFAGISKFKFRKEEAERKLENSRQNLERVNDLIINLEKEVESLKTQAEVAKSYNELKLKLRDFELRFEALRALNFKKEIESKNKQKEEALKKLNDYLSNKEKKEAHLIEIENNIITLENKLNELKDEHSHLEKSFGEANVRISGYIDKKNLLSTQLNNMGLKLEEGLLREKALRNELEEKMKEFDTLEEEKEDVSEKLSELQSKIDGFQNEIKKLDSQILEKSKSLGFNRIVSKDDIDRIKSELISSQTKLENLRNSLTEKWDKNKTFELELSDKMAQIEIKKKELDKLKQESENITKELEDNRKIEEDTKKENKNIEENIIKLENNLKKLDEVILSSLEKQAIELKKFMSEKGNYEKNLNDIMRELRSYIESGKDKDSILSLLDRLNNFFGEYREHYEKILNIIYNDEEGYLKKEQLQKSIEDFRKTIQENRGTLERKAEKIKELLLIKEEIQKNYNRAEFEYNNLLKEKNKLEDNIKSTNEEVKFVEAQITSLSQTVQDKQIQLESIMKIIDEYEDRIFVLREERSSYFDELNKVKIDFTRLEEKKKSVSIELKRIESQIIEIEKMKEGYEKDRKNTEEVIKELDLRIQKETEENERFKIRLTELSREIESLKTNLNGYDKERKLFEAEIKEIELNYQKLEKSIFNIENAISERKVFLDTLRENVLKNFNVEIDGVEIKEGDNFDVLSREINLCREMMQGFGEINFLAIEQYQNARERLEFLTSQKADIEKAIADIENLIKETNQKSEEKFSASFEEIRKAFKKIFARLFDGGRADLILENKDDILNSGINIMAEPPGKKFQSISLLSGGERALVAIAVIFSILYLKPTPFVVLDEMDAPLDDDNIERFKSLLKDFKETSQFIIVSHSKSTLEICDALYGVTMEELGVSKVVSVAFDEAEKIVNSVNAENV